MYCSGCNITSIRKTCLNWLFDAVAKPSVSNLRNLILRFEWM